VARQAGPRKAVSSHRSPHQIEMNPNQVPLRIAAGRGSRKAPTLDHEMMDD
jgi:hypothetical protein